MNEEESKKLRADTDAYLRKIRSTITASRRLVEAAKLRIDETDRLIEKQGMTREQIMGLKFTKSQQEAVNDELRRLGMPEISGDEFDAMNRSEPPAMEPFSAGREAGANFSAGDIDGTIENRKRKFNVMMQQFRM